MPAVITIIVNCRNEYSARLDMIEKKYTNERIKFDVDLVPYFRNGKLEKEILAKCSLPPPKPIIGYQQYKQYPQYPYEGQAYGSVRREQDIGKILSAEEVIEKRPVLQLEGGKLPAWIQYYEYHYAYKQFSQEMKNTFSLILKTVLDLKRLYPHLIDIDLLDSLVIKINDKESKKTFEWDAKENVILCDNTRAKNLTANQVATIFDQYLTIIDADDFAISPVPSQQKEGFFE